MKRSDDVEDKAARKETALRVQQATMNIALGRYQRIQLVAPNAQTGLGEPGRIVSVHEGTAKRLIGLHYAAPVSEVAPAPAKAEAKEGEE